MILFSGSLFIIVLLVWALSLRFTGATSIGSPMYDQIMLSKDLTADILPPPEYIVDSYALAMEYVYAFTGDEYERISGELEAAKARYMERNKYWQENLPDYDNLRALMLNDAYQGAMEFYDVFDKKVVEAKKWGANLQQAVDALTEAFERHKRATLEVVTLSEKYLTATLAEADAKEFQKNIFMTALLIAALLVVAAFAVYLTISLARPLRRITRRLRSMADGDLSKTVSQRDMTKDEIGQVNRSLQQVMDQINMFTSGLTRMSEEIERGEIDARMEYHALHGAYQQAAVGVNTMVKDIFEDLTAYIDCLFVLGGGDFETTLPQMPGKLAVMNQSVETLRASLTGVAEEIGTLADHASRGMLSERVDAEKYKGGWATLLKKLDRLMDHVEKPIRETSAVLEYVAQGNFDHHVEGRYHGDFKLIQNSINSTVDNINVYISEISDVLIALSNNDLNQRITQNYVGKFSVIKEALNRIIVGLNEVISRIFAAADQVSAASRSIADSSMALAEGSNRQSSEIENLKNRLDIIDHNIEKTANDAEAAEKLAVSSRADAERGDHDMKMMVSAMDTIDQSSKAIATIVKVINEIANNTNLLALNAAVEAARAGIHGKGFSVVAQEVRNLSVKSSNAAKEIVELIQTSQKNVSQGANAAHVTAETLRAIVSGAEKITGTIAGIDHSLIQQTQAVHEISSSLGGIVEVVHGNSSTSQEAAAASEQLSSQAEVLRQMVAVFKLRDA
jgi:methyl-accepting chemotaxis protein